jgi:uncharacterized membrane-anchored protein YitT (DUF2179 family)
MEIELDTNYENADIALDMDIPDAMNKVIQWLDQKSIRQTDKYWMYIYIDRLFNIIILVSSGVSVALYVMDLLDNEASIYEYIMFGLLIMIFVAIVSKLFGHTSNKCVSYKTTSILYKQILCDTKKKMSRDLTTYEIQDLYQKINNQIIYIDSFTRLHM